MQVATRQKAISELRDALERLRPWQDRDVVREALLRWADDRNRIALLRWPERVPARVDGFEVDAIAGELQSIGQAESDIDAEVVSGAVVQMFANIRARKAATDFDGYYVDQMTGSARSASRYRADSLRDPDRATRALQRRLDVADMVVGRGWTPQSARAWLRRNPGLHAKDAPPAKRRRRSGLEFVAQG